MEGLKTQFSSSKFPRTCGRICSKFIENLGTRPQKHSLALCQGEMHSGTTLMEFRVQPEKAEPSRQKP